MPHFSTSKKISMILVLGAPPAKLSEVFDWDHFFAMLTPAWSPSLGPWKQHDQFFLGFVVRRSPFRSRSSRAPPRPWLPVAYIPNNFSIRVKEWTLGTPPRSTTGQLYEPERAGEGFPMATLCFPARDVQHRPRKQKPFVYVFIH